MQQLSTLSARLLFGLILVTAMGALEARAQAPAVTTLLPARQAVAAPRLGPVTANLTQAITASSAANLRVYGNQVRGRRLGTVSGGGTTSLSFAPAQAFAPGERVSVTVPNTLTNAAARVSIYPNPARQQFALEAPAGLLAQAGTLALLNSLGQVVQLQPVAAAPAGGTSRLMAMGWRPASTWCGWLWAAARR